MLADVVATSGRNTSYHFVFLVGLRYMSLSFANCEPIDWVSSVLVRIERGPIARLIGRYDACRLALCQRTRTFGLSMVATTMAALLLQSGGDLVLHCFVENSSRRFVDNSHGLKELRSHYVDRAVSNCISSYPGRSMGHRPQSLPRDEH
jgi:hypothetical protein